MIKKRVFLYLIVVYLILFSIRGYGIEPIQPIAQTESLIKDEHIATREFCQKQWDSKEILLKNELDAQKLELESRFKKVLWFDRIVSFGSLLVASFLALTYRNFLNKRSDKKFYDLQKMEMEREVGEVPTPIKEYEKEKRNKRKNKKTTG